MASFWVTFEALARINPIKLLGVKFLTCFVSYPVLERLEKLFRIMKWSSLQNDQAYLHQKHPVTIASPLRQGITDFVFVNFGIICSDKRILIPVCLFQLVCGGQSAMEDNLRVANYDCKKFYDIKQWPVL